MFLSDPLLQTGFSRFASCTKQTYRITPFSHTTFMHTSPACISGPSSPARNRPPYHMQANFGCPHMQGMQPRNPCTHTIHSRSAHHAISPTQCECGGKRLLLLHYTYLATSAPHILVKSHNACFTLLIPISQKNPYKSGGDRMALFLGVTVVLGTNPITTAIISQSLDLNNPRTATRILCQFPRSDLGAQYREH